MDGKGEGKWEGNVTAGNTNNRKERKERNATVKYALCKETHSNHTRSLSMDETF